MPYEQMQGNEPGAYLSPTKESRIAMRMAMKQDAFLHAFKNIGNFNITEACRATGISRSSIAKWQRDYPDFAEKLVMVEEERKDFIESQLMRRIRRNDTAAIIFAAKTKLRDRGYGEHKTIEATVSHELSKEQIDAIARAKERRIKDAIDITPKLSEKNREYEEEGEDSEE